MANNNGDVSNSVLSIIAAFTSGLDIFKKLRSKRRKAKSSKQVDRPSSQELILSDSLRRGPVAIHEEYERSVDALGGRFATGDVIAKASLAETLLKLNTGLVGIISSFLTCGKNKPHLDYQSLISLSDTSRKEAVDTLGQLYQRLSQSQILLSPQASACRQGGSRHHGYSGGQEKSSGRSRQPHRRARGSSDAERLPTVARIPIKASSQPQLALVRPRTRRTTSSSSTSSGVSDASTRTAGSTSTAPTTPHDSPLSSPRPATRKPDEAHSRTEITPVTKPAEQSTVEKIPLPGMTRAHSPKARPSMTGNPPIPPKIAISAKEQAIRDEYPRTYHELLMSTPAPPYSLHQQPMPRLNPTQRTDRMIPSMYSFASDSTKLGEIPMHRWIKPYDYDEMERLNAEAQATGGWRPPVEEPKEKGKSRFFKFLRRTEN